ncbi:Mu transposase C-terminal domain-containing protein [Neisseria sicca]|uniref:Mu transposase C-terminal domain-containing protein n=1 Tax=Neisseria sicca TaxID=490 RepID=UPI0028F0644F|nr:Mu transposase C-terminal domain-containing protein [Neisseria sicca]
MKTHYSILELLEMKLENLPTTKMGLGSKVARESWPFIEVAGKGGKGGKRREYAPPPEVLKLIQAKKLNEVLGGLSDLPELQPSPRPSPTGRGGDAAGFPSPQPSPDVRGGQLTIGVADGSTEQQRLCESARRGVLSAVERVMAESGVSKEAAMTTVLTQAKMPGFEHIAKLFSLAADGRGGGGKLPSVRTIKRWFAARESNSLAPKARTEDMNVPSWLPVFLECYRLPMKPSVSEAYRLFVNRLEALPYPQPSPAGRGADVPSIHQVRRWLGKLGNVERERGRRGARDLKNILPHKRRDFLHLKPAAIYTADGHTFDAEVLNPLSGLPFRPEITTVLDVGTRRCMGWSVGLAESRFTVLEALSHASRAAIGALWYVDWGRGFENLMMTDEATGLMGRLGMTMTHSRAYNSQAKGASERSHNIFTRAAANLPSFVGKNMDDEARQKLFKLSRKEVRLHGKILNSPIPTWDEFKGYIERVVDEYNDRPHRSLPKFTDRDGKRRHMSPNEFWALKVAEFGEPPSVSPEEEGYLFRPQVMRTVRRGEVSLFSNTYYSAELMEFNGETVRVGYDVQDALWVWIYDDVGRLICKAEWHGNSTDYMPVSVLERAEDKRNDERLKRNELQQQNILKERRVPTIEHQDSVNIGGMVLDMSQIKAKAAALAERRSREDDVVVEVAAVKAVEKPSETEAAAGWSVPSEASERFALYQRLCGQTDLPPQAQRWLERYPQSNEYKALSKRAMMA